ncbi:protein naked cuticle homolog [Cloeon dipterum]|uniref:protein naked cuticle homolog n=1 Tax=Cloeon dipterum TaxID=197152 RepID=UPI00321F7AF1
MASNLVKKLRNRFLNGYKQISVLMPGDTTSESGRETEELLSTSSAPASPTPLRPEPAPMPPSSSAKQDKCCCGLHPHCQPVRRDLEFEEFECDVAVQEHDDGGVAQSGEKCRRCEEFSFTLYDLDGHGKITKDDIASLVTSIYDTLGATIQVPHSGSKTIRVRLTVAPERKSESGARASSPQNHKHCQSKNVNHQSSEPAVEKIKEALQRKNSPLKEGGEQRLNNHVPCKKETFRIGGVKVLYTNHLNNNNNNNNNNNSFKQDIMRNNNETGPLIVNNTPHITKKISRHESLRRDRLPNCKVSALANGASASAPNTPLKTATSTPKAKCQDWKANFRNRSPNRPKRRATFNALSSPRHYPEYINQERTNEEYKEIIANNMKKNLSALQSTHRRKRVEETMHKHQDSARSHHDCKKRSAETRQLLFPDMCLDCDQQTNQHGLRHKNRVRDNARSQLQVKEWLKTGCWGYYLTDEDGHQMSYYLPNLLSQKTPPPSSPVLEKRLINEDSSKIDFLIPDTDPPLVRPDIVGSCTADDDVDAGSTATTRRTRRHVHEHVHHHYHHYSQENSKKPNAGDL